MGPAREVSHLGRNPNNQIHIQEETNMKRNIKRILSLSLALTLCAGLLPTVAAAAGKDTAHPSTQSVLVDGTPVEFQCYALKDENGYDTNYIKLRDLAAILNGTNAQFEVGWNGDITITTKTAYTPNGSERNTPFSGRRAFEKSAAKTLVDGVAVDLDAIVLKDDDGGGYTYYQLRDLARLLGFNVGWSAEKGMFLETDKPYDANN